MRRERWAVVGVVMVVVAIVVALGVGVGRGNGLLDSTQDSGFRGLRLLLEQYGIEARLADRASVEGLRPAANDTVFVLSAAGDDSQVLQRWADIAARGATVVLGSPTDGPPGAPGSLVVPTVDSPDIAAGSCDIDGLGDLSRVRLPQGSSTTLEVPDGAASCFGNGSQALITRGGPGRDRVVTLASSQLFSNRAMRADTYPSPTQQLDNSIVAMRLLAPEGTRRVLVVAGRASTQAGQGEQSPLEFLSTGWRLALAQLLVVALVAAWWRSVRHGRVVSEPLPVSVAGSELVAAVADLRRRQQQPERSAELLRRGVALDLSRRLGLTAAGHAVVEPSALAGAVARRTGRPLPEVRAALWERPVFNDEQLVELARELESLRQEVLRV